MWSLIIPFISNGNIKDAKQRDNVINFVEQSY